MTWRDKGRQEVSGLDLGIHGELTAVENFLAFNKMTGYRRKIAPLSSAKDGFVSFSERELVTLCWKREPLKAQILELARASFQSCSSLYDVKTI